MSDRVVKRYKRSARLHGKRVSLKSVQLILKILTRSFDLVFFRDALLSAHQANVCMAGLVLGCSLELYDVTK